MDEIGFIFQISDLDIEALMPQISKALEKRLEVRSREAMPKMWKKTDQLNEENKMTKEELKRYRLRKKIIGVILMVLGLVALVPGIMQRGQHKLLTVIGIIAIVVGFSRFRSSGSIRDNSAKFEKAAREFLTTHEENIKDQAIQICFSDEEMVTVVGELEDLDQEATTFDQVEFVFETKDVFFVIHQRRGVILQKKNITLGTVDEFREFVNENIKKIIPIEEE